VNEISSFHCQSPDDRKRQALAAHRTATAHAR
jgi:hypothetical protein